MWLPMRSKSTSRCGCSDPLVMAIKSLPRTRITGPCTCGSQSLYYYSVIAFVLRDVMLLCDCCQPPLVRVCRLLYLRSLHPARTRNVVCIAFLGELGWLASVTAILSVDSILASIVLLPVYR